MVVGVWFTEEQLPAYKDNQSSAPSTYIWECALVYLEMLPSLLIFFFPEGANHLDFLCFLHNGQYYTALLIAQGLPRCLGECVCAYTVCMCVCVCVCVCV